MVLKMLILQISGNNVHGKQYMSLLECSLLTAKFITFTKSYYDDWNQILDLKNNDSFVAGTRDSTYGIPSAQYNGSSNFFDITTSSTAGVLIGVNHFLVNNLAYNSVGLDLLSIHGGMYYETHWFLGEDLAGSAAR